VAQLFSLGVMADAPPDWKVDCLKTIQTMPHGSCFERGKTSKQDLIWIRDLERDGYISAKFRMGYFEDGDKFADSTIPNLVWDVHVLDAGRQFILDFESPKDDLVKNDGEHWYKKPVGIVVLAVVGGLLLALLKHYFGL
jgi:hypothetical protein